MITYNDEIILHDFHVSVKLSDQGYLVFSISDAIFHLFYGCKPYSYLFFCHNFDTIQKVPSMP